MLPQIFHKRLSTYVKCQRFESSKSGSLCRKTTVLLQERLFWTSLALSIAILHRFSRGLDCTTRDNQVHLGDVCRCNVDSPWLFGECIECQIVSKLLFRCSAEVPAECLPALFWRPQTRRASVQHVHRCQHPGSASTMREPGWKLRGQTPYPYLLVRQFCLSTT